MLSKGTFQKITQVAITLMLIFPCGKLLKNVGAAPSNGYLAAFSSCEDSFLNFFSGQSPATDSDSLNYDIRYDVELVPQTSSVSCWAAAVAMIVGWRDLVILDPEEIAEGVGYWAQYHNVEYSGEYFNSSGLPPDDLNMFEVWGLVPETKLEFSVSEFKELLANYGPLWVASAESLTSEEAQNPHIRVVTGIVGDGTSERTILYINDPWDRRKRRFSLPNYGSVYTETYTDFVRKQSTIQNRELRDHPNAIYIAHP